MIKMVWSETVKKMSEIDDFQQELTDGQEYHVVEPIFDASDQDTDCNEKIDLKQNRRNVLY